MREEDLYKLWQDIAKEKEAKYIVIMLDRFSYEKYPIFCKDDAEVQQIKKEIQAQ